MKLKEYLKICVHLYLSNLRFTLNLYLYMNKLSGRITKLKIIVSCETYSHQRMPWYIFWIMNTNGWFRKWLIHISDIWTNWKVISTYFIILELKNESMEGKKPDLSAFAKECRKSKFSTVAIPFYDFKRLLYCLQNNDLEILYGGDIFVQMWRITAEHFYRVSKILISSITKLWGICKKFIYQKTEGVIATLLIYRIILQKSFLSFKN